MSHPYGTGLVSEPFAIVNGQARFNPRATEEQELLRAAKLGNVGAWNEVQRRSTLRQGALRD